MIILRSANDVLSRVTHGIAAAVPGLAEVLMIDCALGGNLPVTGRTCNHAIVIASCPVVVLFVEKVTVAVVLVTTIDALVISLLAV